MMIAVFLNFTTNDKKNRRFRKNGMSMNTIRSKSWHSVTLILLILSGLVLVNVAVFASEFSSVHLMQWIYTLNPRCWPVWYAWNFWLLAAGTGCYLLLKNCEKRKAATYVLMGTWLTVGLIVFTFSFFCKMLRIQAYYVLMWLLTVPHEYFYKPFISIPLTEFSATGTLSWKLLILPLLGIAGIAFLIRWGRKKKNQAGLLRNQS